jgi:hypothetical protein
VHAIGKKKAPKTGAVDLGKRGISQHIFTGLQDLPRDLSIAMVEKNSP